MATASSKGVSSKVPLHYMHYAIKLGVLGIGRACNVTKYLNEDEGLVHIFNVFVDVPLSHVHDENLAGASKYFESSFLLSPQATRRALQLLSTARQLLLFGKAAKKKLHSTAMRVHKQEIYGNFLTGSVTLADFVRSTFAIRKLSKVTLFMAKDLFGVIYDGKMSLTHSQALAYTVRTLLRNAALHLSFSQVYPSSVFESERIANLWFNGYRELLSEVGTCANGVWKYFSEMIRDEDPLKSITAGLGSKAYTYTECRKDIVVRGSYAEEEWIPRFVGKIQPTLEKYWNQLRTLPESVRVKIVLAMWPMIKGLCRPCKQTEWVSKGTLSELQGTLNLTNLESSEDVLGGVLMNLVRSSEKKLAFGARDLVLSEIWLRQLLRFKVPPPGGVKLPSAHEVERKYSMDSKEWRHYLSLLRYFLSKREGE